MAKIVAIGTSMAEIVPAGGGKRAALPESLWLGAALAACVIATAGGFGCTVRLTPP